MSSFILPVSSSPVPQPSPPLFDFFGVWTWRKGFWSAVYVIFLASFFFNLVYVGFILSKNEFTNVPLVVVTILACLSGSVLLVFYRIVNCMFSGLKRFQFLKRLGSKVLILALSSEIFNIVLNSKSLHLYVTCILWMGVLVADGALFHPERDSGVADVAFLGSLRLLCPHLFGFIIGFFPKKEKKMGISTRLIFGLFQHKTPVPIYSGAALASYCATFVSSSIAMAQLPALDKVTSTLNEAASNLDEKLHDGNLSFLSSRRQPPQSTRVVLQRRKNENRSEERPLSNDDSRTPPLRHAFFSCDFDYPFSRQKRLSETPRVRHRPSFHINLQYWEKQPQRKTRKALFPPSSDDNEIIEHFEKGRPKKIKVGEKESEKPLEKSKQKKKKKFFLFSLGCH